MDQPLAPLSADLTNTPAPTSKDQRKSQTDWRVKSARDRKHPAKIKLTNEDQLPDCDGGLRFSLGGRLQSSNYFVLGGRPSCPVPNYSDAHVITPQGPNRQDTSSPRVPANDRQRCDSPDSGSEYWPLPLPMALRMTSGTSRSRFDSSRPTSTTSGWDYHERHQVSTAIHADQKAITMPAIIELSADVDEDAEIGDGTHVWHLAQVRERAVVGANCVIGRGSYVGRGVSVGPNCKIQNFAQVYEPAVVGPGAFIGPGAVLTNDQYPRAVNPDLSRKSASHWEPAGVEVGGGASIGARAVCVAPVKIGRWAMVAAGAVVVDDVSDFALVAGVPAKQIGWVGRSGYKLTLGGDGGWHCPRSGLQYAESNGGLMEVLEDPAGQ